MFTARRLTRSLLTLAFTTSAGAALEAQSAVAPVPKADSVAVVSVLERMFDALRVKDRATLESLMHPDARFTLLRPAARGGDSVQVNVMSLTQFLDATMRPESAGLDELIRNVRVTVDGPLATAWGEYQVRVNGAVSHCGYDAFHLVRSGGTWRVLGIADSFRREGCGAAWPT